MENKVKIPEWLKNLQENSWELELLISGGAIFTLIKASDIVLNSITYLRMTTAIPLTIFYIIAIFGLKLLTFGFILHLILRAYWVAMVFINFVFPGGVKKEKLTYKRPFRQYIDERSDLYDSLMRVDKLAGLVMFLSISYSLVIVGLIVVLLVLGPLVGSLHLKIVYWVFFPSLAVYIIDLLSFGSLRKLKYLSYILFPFFKLYDILSLRFIYAKPLLIYSTNINKWKATGIIFVFMLFVLTSTYVTVQRHLKLPNYFDRREYRWQCADNVGFYNFYKDEEGNGRVTIPSKIIESNFLELTIEYWAIENSYIDLLDKPTNARYMADVFEVCIDDSIYSNIEWFPFWDNTDKNTLGIKAMIPIMHLSQGKHILYVSHSKEIREKAEQNNMGVYTTEIPFWKNE
jgi:hypothetical protein